MSATVDKAALEMLLADHEIHHATTSVASFKLGWSVTVTCRCGHTGPMNRRADHYADALTDGILVWLLPDGDTAPI